MKKSISKWVMCATALAITSIANAAPFSVTYTDTISYAGSAAGINVGQQAQATLVFDNGGASAANQTWTAANVQCVIFTFNNAADKFVAANYAGSSFPVTTGSFTTNGSGQLQAGTIDWDDDSDPTTVPFVTNIAGVTSFDDWYLDGANSVVYLNVSPIAYTNVTNDTQVTNWSNPTPAGGVCASFFATKPQQAISAIPTLSQWGMIILSALLGVAALLALRRYRR